VSERIVHEYVYASLNVMQAFKRSWRLGWRPGLTKALETARQLAEWLDALVGLWFIEGPLMDLSPEGVDVALIPARSWLQGGPDA
jgi:hypothetical protein